MKIQKSENIRTPHPDRVYEMLSRKTLNEEIGMSQQGIDYVNSLEVKEPVLIELNNSYKEFNYEVNRYLCSMIVTDDPNLRLTLEYIESIDKEKRYLLNICDLSIDKINSYYDYKRIKKEARNNLIFVAIVLIIVVIVNWKS